MKILITFIILSIVNVVFSTVRSIATIKSGKTIASLLSGGYFAFYNIMLIYTVADFPMWQKCIITFICNVVGVWLVKFAEEKTRKDKLWKVEMTAPTELKQQICETLSGMSYNCIDTNGNYTIFNIFCPTQKESTAVKKVLKQFKEVKYFVSESKML